MWRSQAAKGWFDCGTHCTTTQNLSGGVFVGGGFLVLLLVLSTLVTALIGLVRTRVTPQSTKD